MKLRLWHDEWQQWLRKFIANPVTEIVAILLLVAAALALLVSVESRVIRGTQAPVIFSPK
jgi:type IV secretory pathway VirB2 component (pilin)